MARYDIWLITSLLDQLLSFLSQFVPVIFIIGIILLIVNVKKKADAKTAAERGSSGNEVSHLDYLIEQLSKAKTDGIIDEETFGLLRERFEARRERLLAFDQGIPGRSEVEPAYARVWASPSKPEFHPGPREPLTVAKVTRWLLYLGVFLLFIATVIFAVYKWESFSQVAKFLILVGITFAFYAGGWFVMERLDVRTGGIALAVVGVIMTFFDGYLYLNSKSLLASEPAWAVVFVVCAVVYMAAALALDMEALVYLSCAGQALAVASLGVHYYSLAAASAVDSQAAILGTTIALVMLAVAWLAAGRSLRRIERVSGLFGNAPNHMAFSLIGLTLSVHIMTLAYYYKTWTITPTTFALSLAYDLSLAGFCLISYLFEKRGEDLYPIFAAKLFGLVAVLFFFKIPTAYYSTCFTLLAGAWIGSAFALRALGKFQFFGRASAYASYLVAALASLMAVYKVLTAIALDSLGASATVANIVALSALALFFALAVVYERKGGFAYPALLFLTGCYQLTLLRVGLAGEYLGVPTALLAPTFFVASLVARSRFDRELSKPALRAAYAMSLYGLLFGLADQPSLMAVLLINGALYLAVALVLATKETQLHIWIALGQVAAALFVALDYHKASHLLANVSYVSLYIAVFAVALALREAKLRIFEGWAEELFKFSIVFCLLQLVIQVVAFLSVSSYTPSWLYSIDNDANILMLAFVVAGFFYLTASNLFEHEGVGYLGYLFFLAAYLVKLSDFDVSFIEWYSVPTAVYLIAMGYVYRQRHPDSEILQLSNPVGLFVGLVPSTVAYMATVEAPATYYHALFAAAVAVAFMAAGVFGRLKIFFFGGVFFLSWNAIYQSWGYLYALPKWLTIGLLGLLLLVCGILMERRRDQFVRFLKSAREQLIEEWS